MARNSKRRTTPELVAELREFHHDEAAQRLIYLDQAVAALSTIDPTTNVTRFEVIDTTGRSFVRYGVSVDVDFQDDGRTMKVFLRDGEPFVTDMRGWNDRQS